MSEYEFNDTQNRVFAKLAGHLRGFGIQLGIFAAVLMFLGLVFTFRGSAEVTDSFTAVMGGAGIVFMGALVLAFCLRMLKPVAQFREIVTTKGHDVAALMNGLDELAMAHRTLRLILVLLLMGAALGVYRLLT
jgi:hypothetical protein